MLQNEKVIDLINNTLLSIQVTYLSCGSVVLGTYADHILMDGRSSSQFLHTWGKIALGDDLTSIVPPSFDNTPLSARSPPKINFEFPGYTTNLSEKEENYPEPDVFSLFKISKEQIRNLKIRCSKDSNTTYVSTFCAVSALVWKCFCLAQKLLPDTKSCIHFAADIRNRINPPMPVYIGNGAIRMAVASKVSIITSSSFGHLASIVKYEVDKLTDEYVRSLIDYQKVMLDKKMSLIVRPMPESDLCIRTILGVPLLDINFGWGAPQILSWERTTQKRVAYIMNELGELGEDAGIKIVMSLSPSTMERFKRMFYELLFADEKTNS